MTTKNLKKLHLGAKIRLLREKRGISLADLAKRVSLNERLLTDIEQGVITPPIATLINFGEIFKCELDDFLKESAEDKPYCVTRKGKEKKGKRSLPKGKAPLSYTYKALASKKVTKKMEPLIVEFNPTDEPVDLVSHDGEEFLYLLKGELEFRINKTKVKLKAGDSLYFESKQAHAFKALGKKKAVAVCVVYPH